jgi:hypothetical protein
MELAAKVLRLAAPDLRPPTAVRSEGDEPLLVAVDGEAELFDRLVALASAESTRPGIGNVAVVCPRTL